MMSIAGKRGLDITPGTGQDLDEIVRRTVDMPAEALVLLKKLLGI